MGIIERFFSEYLTERPARKATWEQQIADLEAGGTALQTRLAAAPDLPRNREVLRHIVGIERWGQSRLRSALGAPLIMDEYDGHRPDAAQDWEALKAGFAATRAGTLALARELQAAGIDRARSIPHNQMGSITVGGWLQYLKFHARLEGMRIR